MLKKIYVKKDLARCQKRRFLGQIPWQQQEIVLILCLTLFRKVVIDPRENSIERDCYFFKRCLSMLLLCPSHKEEPIFWMCNENDFANSKIFSGGVMKITDFNLGSIESTPLYCTSLYLSFRNYLWLDGKSYFNIIFTLD